MWIFDIGLIYVVVVVKIFIFFVLLNMVIISVNSVINFVVIFIFVLVLFSWFSIRIVNIGKVDVRIVVMRLFVLLI